MTGPITIAFQARHTFGRLPSMQSHRDDRFNTKNMQLEEETPPTLSRFTVAIHVLVPSSNQSSVVSPEHKSTLHQPSPSHSFVFLSSYTPIPSLTCTPSPPPRTVLPLGTRASSHRPCTPHPVSIQTLSRGLKTSFPLSRHSHPVRSTTIAYRPIKNTRH